MAVKGGESPDFCLFARCREDLTGYSELNLPTKLIS